MQSLSPCLSPLLIISDIATAEFIQIKTAHFHLIKSPRESSSVQFYCLVRIVCMPRGSLRCHIGQVKQSKMIIAGGLENAL